MKITRSTKCSLKFATVHKHKMLAVVLTEYGEVVNHFIGRFWENCPVKVLLLKDVVDTPNTWLSARLRKVAAREAIDMVKAAKKKEAAMPVHRGERMCLSGTIAVLHESKTLEFDAWLHLACIGEKIILDLPIRYHKHWHKLATAGKRLNAYIITCNYVQFAFEVETGSKREPVKMLGMDTGIRSLATLSDGTKMGTDIQAGIARIKRCGHGSKGQKRATRALRQRIDEVAMETVSRADLLVVERLKGITQKTRGRLNRPMRYSIGRWNVRYWLTRLQQNCEWNRVSWRSVPAFNTSRTCPSCGHVDRRNRSGEKFQCRACGLTGDADVIAARNILDRFLTGDYGPSCKPLVEICP